MAKRPHRIRHAMAASRPRARARQCPRRGSSGKYRHLANNQDPRLQVQGTLDQPPAPASRGASPRAPGTRIAPPPQPTSIYTTTIARTTPERPPTRRTRSRSTHLAGRAFTATKDFWATTEAIVCCVWVLCVGRVCMSRGARKPSRGRNQLARPVGFRA